MLYDLDSARLARKPLADTESAAVAALRTSLATAMMDHGELPDAEEVLAQAPSSCTRNCMQGRMCDCRPDVDEQSAEPCDDFALFRGLRIALLIVAAVAFVAFVAIWLKDRLATPLDRPAAALQSVR